MHSMAKIRKNIWLTLHLYLDMYNIMRVRLFTANWILPKQKIWPIINVSFWLFIQLIYEVRAHGSSVFDSHFNYIFHYSHHLAPTDRPRPAGLKWQILPQSVFARRNLNLWPWWAINQETKWLFPYELLICFAYSTHLARKFPRVLFYIFFFVLCPLLPTNSSPKEPPNKLN